MGENVLYRNRGVGGWGWEKVEEVVVRCSAISPSILSCCLLITVIDTMNCLFYDV